MIGSIAKYATAGMLVVTACLLPHRADSQSIASRVAQVRDGKVRMSFASRDDICGWGDGISTNYSGRTNSRSKWNNRSDDVDYDDSCMAGPARVVLTLSGGKVTKVRSYVGGCWRTPADATDIGTVSARDAVDYLLGVANRDDGKGAGEAIFATSIAENESRSDEVRGQAIFWLGQTRTDKSGEYLRSLYRKIRDEDVKDKVI